MLTLGIETSCDETGVAVVEDARHIRSNAVASSVRQHAPYDGVVPEIACRYHVDVIAAVTRRALADAGCRPQDIDLIAVTSGPGLPGALLIGVSAAKALALAWGCPLIGVNHLQAHAAVGASDEDFPYMALIVSGGHTSLVAVQELDRWRPIGQTRDDAAGEAFDKVSSLLGLGYPGGPAIQAAAERGNPGAVSFPRARCRQGVFDFSFSGLKTAVLHYLRDAARRDASNGARDALLDVRDVQFAPSLVADVAASFQEAVVDVLVERSIQACREYRMNRLVLGGGVSANRRLRERLTDACPGEGIHLVIPEMRLCLDNGVMIAILGERLYRRGWRSDDTLGTRSDAAVDEVLATLEATC